MLKTEPIGPGGQKHPEDQYINLGTLMHRRARIGELSQQMMIAPDIFPRFESTRPRAAARAQLAQLEDEEASGAGLEQ